MQDGTDKREIKNRSLIIYLNGNKYTQVTNNSLQYFHPSNQTTTVAVDKVVDQTSGIQDVTTMSPSNPSSNTSNNSSEQSKWLNFAIVNFSSVTNKQAELKAFLLTHETDIVS